MISGKKMTLLIDAQLEGPGVQAFIKGNVHIGYDAPLTAHGSFEVSDGHASELYTNLALIGSNDIFTLSSCGDKEPLRNTLSIQYQSKHPKLANLTVFIGGKGYTALNEKAATVSVEL